MNQKLGKVQMWLGVLILVLGLLSTFIAWFIGVFVIAFGLWNIFVGSQVRKGGTVFIPGDQPSKSNDKPSQS